MKTIVFIGCNKSGTSRDALGVSTEMGYYTVLYTNRKEFLKQRGEFPEVHEMVFVEDLFNKDKIITLIKELESQGREVEAVISLIDPFVSHSAQIAAELGLHHMSIPALALMEDKNRFREQLKNLSVSPQHVSVDLTQNLYEMVRKYESELPLILKAPRSNGSKDVLFAATGEDLKKALHYFQQKFSRQTILLEEYVAGTQYIIEVIVHEGTIAVAAIVEQEIEYQVRFIVTGYLYPARLTEDDQQKLTVAVTDIINSLGFLNGTCHLEMRRIQDGWKLIEINPRMAGGAMNRLIQAGTGLNLIRETLKLYLGTSPHLETSHNRFAFAKFITIQSEGKLIKITGKEQALAYEGVKEVFIKPRIGAFLTRPYSLGDRYAYVIATAKTAVEAKNIAIQAAGEIKFYLEPI